MRHPTSPKRARNRLKVIRDEVAVLVGERKRLEPYSEWHGPELDRIRKQLNDLDAGEVVPGACIEERKSAVLK